MREPVPPRLPPGPESGGGGPATPRPRTPPQASTLALGGFCSGPRGFLSSAGALHPWACQGPPAGAGQRERPLTGKPANPGRPCRREGRVSAGGGGRGQSARVGGWVGVAGGRGVRGGTRRGLRFPPGRHTYLGSRHAGQRSLSARRRNTEPRKEGKDGFMTKVHSSYGTHRTAQKCGARKTAFDRPPGAGLEVPRIRGEATCWEPAPHRRTFRRPWGRGQPPPPYWLGAGADPPASAACERGTGDPDGEAL